MFIIGDGEERGYRVKVVLSKRRMERNTLKKPAVFFWESVNGRERKRALREVVLNIILENRGVAIQENGLLERSRSQKLSKFLRTEYPPLIMVSRGRVCMMAAIANAVDCIAGLSKAVRVMSMLRKQAI